MNTFRKKLIEVALPLDDINTACKREKSIRHGHPSTLHLWWARRPLAAARAVIFAQMVDDPSTIPGLSDKEVILERERLFKIIGDLVKWENTNNKEVFERAQIEIRKSWARTCKETGDDPETLPSFHDPFAGGGALPLEAQRLGLESYASDLNPLAVMINKAMIEIPPKFAGITPVNPETTNKKSLIAKQWKGAEGLAEDVRYYGQWIRDEAEKRIGHLYPKVKITNEMLSERSDLKEYLGQELTVIAWIWARTVKSPNPVFNQVDIPLISSFYLSTKKGKEHYIHPVVNGENFHFIIKSGQPNDKEAVNAGTSAGKRQAFRCLLSGVPVSYQYIREEGTAGRIGSQLIAMVAQGKKNRVYLNPTPDMESIARKATPTFKPDTQLFGKCKVNVSNYGLNQYGDLFTPRQLLSLSTLAELTVEARDLIQNNSIASGMNEDPTPLRDGGKGATAYADAVRTCSKQVSKYDKRTGHLVKKPRTKY